MGEKFEISEDEVITVVIAVSENFFILLSSNVHRKLGRYLKKGGKKDEKDLQYYHKLFLLEGLEGIT